MCHLGPLTRRMSVARSFAVSADYIYVVRWPHSHFLENPINILNDFITSWRLKGVIYACILKSFSSIVTKMESKVSFKLHYVSKSKGMTVCMSPNCVLLCTLASCPLQIPSTYFPHAHSWNMKLFLLIIPFLSACSNYPRMLHVNYSITPQTTFKVSHLKSSRNQSLMFWELKISICLSIHNPCFMQSYSPLASCSFIIQKYFHLHFCSTLYVLHKLEHWFQLSEWNILRMLKQTILFFSIHFSIFTIASFLFMILINVLTSHISPNFSLPLPSLISHFLPLQLQRITLNCCNFSFYSIFSSFSSALWYSTVQYLIEYKVCKTDHILSLLSNTMTLLLFHIHFSFLNLHAVWKATFTMLKVQSSMK